MRPNQGSIIRYTPAHVPEDAGEIPRFLRDELTKLQGVLSALADGQLDVTEKAPTKPRDGMIRLADGTNWNPGSGRGFYGYSNGAWRFLG